MNQKQIKAAVEAMLFAAGDPVSADKLAAAVQLPQTTVETALEDLRVRYAREDSGLCLLHLDTRWQLATKTEWADCVRRLLDARRSVPLGPAAMETLTVIAYYQPATKALVEQIRGVDSAYSVGALLNKHLIEECGRLNVPGRPILYQTTPDFLRTFGLESRGELAKLPEKLQETARLRLEYPELSLAQLAEAAVPPVTKSCLNHRLRKLVEWFVAHPLASFMVGVCFGIFLIDLCFSIHLGAVVQKKAAEIDKNVYDAIDVQKLWHKMQSRGGFFRLVSIRPLTERIDAFDEFLHRRPGNMEQK